MATEVSGGRSTQVQPTINFVEDTPTRIIRIDINNASLEELQRLPGVNLAIAEKIVSARQVNEFVHVNDLLAAKIIPRTSLGKIRAMIGTSVNENPNLHTINSDPKPILYHKPFELVLLFNDSASGVRLIRLQADSVSHSIDIAQEVSEAERKVGTVRFKMPAMEAGVMNVQVTLYDSAGNKDYIARTMHIFHNPPFVIFYPSEKTLRLSRGAAQMKSDGNFHCNSNFYFYNGSESTVTLNRVLNWRIFRQSGSLIESGSWDFGSNISLGPWAVSTGWWFNFSFPPGNATFNRLKSKEEIRIEWQFTQVGTGAIVADDLTWRAVLGPHVNIIRVGEENFTSTEKTLIFNALRNSAASIYQLQDLDIGTIRTFFITVSQAGGYVTIDSNGEAEDLTEDWTVPNDAIDLFVVRNYVGSVAGLSPVGGPCDKDAKGMNGTVVELMSSQALLGVIMGHELGHYLGLSHTSLSSNFMNPTASTANTSITSSQGNTMKGHCFIRFLS